MVKVIYTADYRTASQSTAAYGVPIVEIHHIERHVHGNGIAIKVWGEMKIAAKERVYAREMGLNTLQVLLLTTETGMHGLIHPQKYIYNKGQLDNYASIDILGPSAAPYEYYAAGRRQAQEVPSTLPVNGSIWLNFHALGE